MEKLLIVGCKKAMDDVCIGCSRCLVGLNRREGEFARYKDQEVQLVGLLNCGDCPGATVITRLAQVNLWNKPMNEKITKVHLGSCINDSCPYKQKLLESIKGRAGVEVIDGTHPYGPQNIFA
jgi:predicted metal-binding protein